MAHYLVTITGKGLRESKVQSLVESLREAEVDVTVRKVEPATSRPARLAEASGYVEDAKSTVEELREELQDWYDNLPENFQSGDKGQQLEEAISGLEEIGENLDQADFDSVEFPGMFG